jgi:hypothetical protein
MLNHPDLLSQPAAKALETIRNFAVDEEPLYAVPS